MRLTPHKPGYWQSSTGLKTVWGDLQLSAVRIVYRFHERMHDILHGEGSSARIKVLRCAVIRAGYLAGFLCIPTAGSFFLQRSVVMAATQEQQQDDKKPPADKPTSGSAAQVPAMSATVAKPATKPKRVITNDDIQSSPFAGFGGLFYTNSGSINDCDANCFDQIRMSAQLNADKNSDWRRDVLRQLDQVRSDGEWQAYLHELYDAHNTICHLTFDKTDELRKSGNTRNLGPQEIGITEKYDEKMKSAQAILSAAVARQSTVQRKFAEKPYANSFATVQGTRMQAGFCSQARVIFLQ
jgi:hypothetical protein